VRSTVNIHIGEHLVSLRSQKKRVSETSARERASDNYQSEVLGRIERTLVYKGRDSLRPEVYILVARKPNKFVVNAVNYVHEALGLSCLSPGAALGSCIGSPEAVKLGNRLGLVEVGLCEVIANRFAVTGAGRDCDRLGRHEAPGGVIRSAYGRQTPPPDYELTCVEPGSPMGELLRRYWQPVCTSDEVRDLPKKVKLLCEELVVFRDKKGHVGPLEPHCSHRGTSLEWGRVEEEGLRCCYHGWL
jgi:hypothetical protein